MFRFILVQVQENWNRIAATDVYLDKEFLFRFDTKLSFGMTQTAPTNTIRQSLNITLTATQPEPNNAISRKH